MTMSQRSRSEIFQNNSVFNTIADIIMMGPTSTDPILVDRMRVIFAFIVFLMSCYFKCSVALPQSALGWSAVCDCGIS